MRDSTTKLSVSYGAGFVSPSGTSWTPARRPCFRGYIGERQRLLHPSAQPVALWVVFDIPNGRCWGGRGPKGWALLWPAPAK